MRRRLLSIAEVSMSLEEKAFDAVQAINTQTLDIIATFSNSLADLSFWIGLISVVLFAKNRFAISLPEPDNLSPPIAARSFTTAFRYQIAAFSYVFLFVAAYFTLILVGCVPTLQQVLVQWIGSLNIDNKTVGTPAWAALAATTLLPSAPGFESIDKKIRQVFQDFASIPQKAELIGREIVRAIAQGNPVSIEQDSPIEDVKLAIQAHRQQFKKLDALSFNLKKIGGPPNVQRAYEKFFEVADKLLETIRGDFKFDQSEMQSDETVRQLEARLSSGMRRMAKLLACALLQSESSELAISTRLSRSNIAIRPISFNFTAKHLVLMFVTIAAVTMVGCYLSLLAFAFTRDNPAALLNEHRSMFLTWPFITWPFATVIVYLLPIVLSAGAVMYKLDRRSWDQAQDFTDRFASGVMVFVGSAGLAFLAVLAYSVAMASINGKIYGTSIEVAVLPLVPWSLPAATVATLFLFNSTRKWGLGKWSGMVIDAATHGVGAALASECAFLLGGMLGDKFELIKEPGLMQFLAPISAGVVGASIGAVLCANTRQHVCKVTAAHATAPQFAPAGALPQPA
jgi:hypothetical protein